MEHLHHHGMPETRDAFLQSFHHELSPSNLNELLPAEQFTALRASPAAGWNSLSLGQQQALLVLFDVYADRLWDRSRFCVAVRSLTEQGWRRCARDLFAHGVRRVPLLPLSTVHGMYRAVKAKRPRSRWGMDFYGVGDTYVLGLIDLGSLWVELVHLPDRSAEGVADATRDRILFRHGTPDQIQSDHAQEFVGKAI